MTDDKTVEVQKTKSEQEKANDFIKEYEALCKKHGFNIVVNPAFKAMTDTGTFAIVLQSSVGKLPKEANK